MLRKPLVAPGPALDAAELERYSRQIRLPQIGLEGQRRLKAARVVVLGAGGLGSPVLSYLAAAGVGTIGIVDDDVIDVSNLQRQTLHTSAGVGGSKAESARASIRGLNPLVTVEVHETRLAAANAERILAGYDLVIDGTDNFSTRYLANDTAARLDLPYIWGSVLRFDGQVSVFWSAAPGGGATLRDLYPTAPADDEMESCSVAGVLGPLCATIGATMAAEAIKLIAGFGSPLIGRLLVVDALDGTFTEVPFGGARPQSQNAGSVADVDTGTGTGTGAGAGTGTGTGPASHPRTRTTPSLSATELAARLGARAAGSDDFILVDVREPWEHELVAIEGSVLVPLASLLSESAREALPTRATLLVHCHHDTRSQYARDVLLQSGWTDVAFVEGGINSWVLDVEHDKPLY